MNIAFTEVDYKTEYDRFPMLPEAGREIVNENVLCILLSLKEAKGTLSRLHETETTLYAEEGATLSDATSAIEEAEEKITTLLATIVRLRARELEY